MTLEINCIGPFAFYFDINNMAGNGKGIYALTPSCDYHYLNVITDLADTPIDSQKSGSCIMLNAVKAGSYTSSNLGAVVAKWHPKATQSWPDPSAGSAKWDFAFFLGWPDRVYPLLRVPATIDYDPNTGDEKPPTAGDQYARGLRVIFDDTSLISKPYLSYETGLLEVKTIPLDRPDAGYSCEIRYTNPDPDDNDAEYCFETLVAGLKGYESWELKLADDQDSDSVLQWINKLARPLGFSLTSIGGPNGHPKFCGAVVIAFF